jgi:hypothetical protein
MYYSNADLVCALSVNGMDSVYRDEQLTISQRCSVLCGIPRQLQQWIDGMRGAVMIKKYAMQFTTNIQAIGYIHI